MNALDKAFLNRLAKLVGKQHLMTDPGERWAYGYDNSRKHSLPDAVVFPEVHEQMRDIVLLCNDYEVPMVARGSGTNTAGGTVPVKHGLIISLERMNQVIAFDPDNRFIKVQTGITNRAVQDAVASSGLFWPPDPTSAEICTVGGNLAMNAAGPRTLKYGSTRENVLGLRAITGKGTEINAGVITTKGVVGYDFVRLLIGSEGTLAIITEATLKLVPTPQTRNTLRLIYKDIHSASAAVRAIMRQPVTPSVLEFMDTAAINIVRDYSDVTIPGDAGALLMIEVEGTPDSIGEISKTVSTVAHNNGLIEISQADNQNAIQQLWAMRKALSPALRKIAPNKVNEDVVVPITAIPALIEGLEKLSVEYKIPIVNFGHAGNGNIHVNLLFDSQNPEQASNAAPCLSAVFDLVLNLGGTLSGEHGIGQEKREFVSREIDTDTLALMWQIKQQFDPKGLLNPGKVFPPEYR